MGCAQGQRRPPYLSAVPTPVTPLAVPPRTAALAAAMLGRTLRRRCPNCGGSAAFAGWFALAGACAACGIELRHGPHDHFVGTTMVNC